jgi:Mycothiol maleylpyruvate isomerase N-terminal domain
MEATAMDRNDIHDELEHARLDFAELVRQLSPEDLRRPSQCTRWTNRQLLFHMVFGYLIVRTLLPLVHLLGRLGWSRRFAATLNAARRPFHLINYFGSVGGGQLLSPPAMARLLDRTIHVLQQLLAHESESSLALAMRFPPDWDPYFQPTMTVRDLYHYGTVHFDHHRHQLST